MDIELRSALIDENAITGESSHGATLSVFGVNPDGNEFELMWMLPRPAWGDYETRAVVKPLDLTTEAERWAGVETAAEHQTELAGDGVSVFLGILESKIDHLADVLESTYEVLEQLSRRVLDRAEVDLQSDLVALAEVEDQNGKIRLNLMDTQRVLNSLLRSDKLDTGSRSHHRLGEVLRDVESLLAHTAFLLEEISFLSDTIIGLISIEQNQIVKVLSVVAVVFLPPTLVASLYGMNFCHMPELSWVVGYPLAVLLMVVLGAAPYLLARRRGWL